MRNERRITMTLIERYIIHLEEQEKSDMTIKKYTHDLKMLCKYVNSEPITKLKLIAWKKYLKEHYAPSSVNSILAALNGLLEYCGWTDLKIKPIKIQKNLFAQEEKELTKIEYMRLVQAANQAKNERLALILQAICATGIRVSELRFITVEAVRTGKAIVQCKGKIRSVFLPRDLRHALRQYAKKQKRPTGCIFVTRTGQPVDRSNIWRDMKNLCQEAGVSQSKVFPHNLRHLFARIYYSIEKDLSRLADILGHANISTTRIYTMESGYVHQRQVEKMGLVCTQKNLKINTIT